jgi:hypothetical protein
MRILSDKRPGWSNARIWRLTLLFAAATLTVHRAEAQVREQPVPFDSAGRVSVITPPLAARLELSAPLWPVDGDYVDARLYSIEGAAGATTFVLVVRRPNDVLERYVLDANQRRELAAAVDRGSALARIAAGPDTAPTLISEPVRGEYVVNQTVLGLILFGPATAALLDDPAASSATYLAVAGGSFFLAANLTRTSPVSRAQNHLSWHSARRGALAADLILYSLAGRGTRTKAYDFATLAGGVAGDIVGFELAKPMTDAEAHGASHGSTVSAVLTTGVLGMAGRFNGGTSRVATGLIVGAGALGYPLGLRYVRTAPYRVTAGDVGTLVTSELLGISAAGTFLPNNPSKNVTFGVLSGGFALGALAGDRWLVRPFDHSESEARLVQVGALAGGLVGGSLLALVRATDSHVIFGTITAGGLFGVMITEGLIEPRKAGLGAGADGPRRGATHERSSRVDVRLSPESVLLAKMGVRGNHPIVSLTF